VRAVPFAAFHQFAIDQQTSNADALFLLDVDVFMVLSGWESRGWEFKRHIELKSGRMFLLDFEIEGAAVQESVTQIEAFAAARSSVQFARVPLAPSVEFRSNISKLTDLIENCVTTGATRIFLDVTCMPRLYIQEIIGWAFRKRRLPILKFGYALGCYDDTDEASKSSHGFSKYVNVPSLSVSDATSRKKVLLASIGVENELFFRLVEDMSPNIVRIIYAPSRVDPRINVSLEAQIKKANELMDVDSVDLIRCEPFDVLETVKLLSSAAAEQSKQAAITIFVAGPKPHAIAAAVVACARPNVSLRARVPPSYRRQPVRALGTYEIITIADLSSPLLAHVGF
jgi:hypothetical protein